MRFVKPHLFHKGSGLFKILFRFSGEASDNVCGQCRIPEMFSEKAAFLPVLSACIPSVHAAKSFVAAALQGQVKVWTKLGDICQGTGKLSGDDARLQGTKADPADTGYVGNPADQRQQAAGITG